MFQLKLILQNGSRLKQEIITLTDNEISEIKLSRKKLLSILKFEELYDQIIESYIEFKAQLYSNSISLVNNFRTDKNSSYEIRSKLNRQLFNTLNFSKLYLDKNYYEHKNKNQETTSIRSFIKKVTDDEILESEMCEFRRDLSKNTPGYVLGCALRNVTQHNTLPIETFTIGIKDHKNETNKTILAKFHLPLSKESLSNLGIRNKILVSFDEIIDLHEIMDEFVDSVSKIHMKNRELTKSAASAAQAKFLVNLEKAKVQYGENDILIEVWENDKFSFYLDLSWYEVVNYLQSKHAVSTNYQKIIHSTYANS